MTDHLPESVRERIFNAVAEENIGQGGRGQMKLWLTEHQYRLLTSAERRALKGLVAEGLIEFEMAGGYGYTKRGLYLLTNAGRRYLRDCLS